MAYKLLDAVSAVGVSRALNIRGISRHVVDTIWNSSMVENTGAEVSAVVVKLQGSETGSDKDTGIITEAALSIGSTAEKVANGAFAFQIDNISYTKAAVAAGTTLVSGLDGLSSTITDYTITANKFGGFKVYITTDGTVKMAFPALTQAYTTIALANTAIDALPSEYIVGGKYIEIGKVIIQADGTTWTATTDDLEAGTDIDTAAFISLGSSFVDLATMTATSDEIANARMSRVIDKQPSRYVRLYLSTLTGTGAVTSRYSRMGVR